MIVQSNDKLDPDFALLWMTNNVATNVNARYGLKVSLHA
jgi:hypothetical protein